ncbi:MAG TPA: hypothetical protein VIF43_01600 [Patescibacteria group bacterium]|jgi:hypothetical protein
MLRSILIAVWSLALLFFVWEFVFAKTLPGRYAKASPNTFRVVDILFAAAIGLTLYYLVTDLS